jgi:hypothetical protein
MSKYSKLEKNMKKQTILTSALLVGVMSLFSLNANEVAAQAAQIVEVAVDEQAFIAQLSEQNQKIFLNQFTAEQKQKALHAASMGKSALDANEVVQKIAHENIAMSEKAAK